MLDEKRLKQAETAVKDYFADGRIKKGDAKFVDFFVNKSLESIECASYLFDESKSGRLNGYLWTINCSYYSMFYMVRALLEKRGIKIKTEMGIHSVVFNCLVCYFYLNKKIEKSLVEEFVEADSESAELLGRDAALGMIEDYYLEKGKREEFTYEMGKIAIEQKASKSLERARRFNEVVRRMLK